MELLGLPLHPLVVHLTVVLVPLVSLGAVVVALWPAARRRYGHLVAVLAVGAAASALVAQKSGEDFMTTFTRPTPAMQHHFDLGTGLTGWVFGLLGALILLMAAEALVKRAHPRGRLLSVIGSVVTVPLAVVSIVQVARIGHAGATAVWGGGS